MTKWDEFGGSSRKGLASPSGRRLRVLVIEDDEDNLRTNLEALELLGHWAAGVRSAEAAMSRYCEGMFDVLLIDVQLPGLSGIDLALKIRALENVPVVFATAMEEFPSVATSSNMTWLEKPYTVDALASALARVTQAGDSSA